MAWVYKCALTMEIARQNQLQPITDQIETHAADQDWTADRIADALLTSPGEQVPRQVQKMHETLALLALEVALPADLDNIPIKKIVHLRQKHGAEFDAFGQLVTATVTELADSLGEVKDPGILDHYVRQEVERRFIRPLHDLRKAMRGVGVESVLGR